MAATRGPQVALEGYARTVARGGAGRTMRENIAAMDALVTAGLVADGNSVDGSARNGGIPYDTVIAQFPHEPLNAWEIPAPRLQLGSGTQIWDKSTPTPIAPGWEFSAIFGPQSARQIFAKTLNVPPRDTFNVIEGVLTLPATVTNNLTYHTAICAFVENQSSQGVAYGVGAHCVAGADNQVVGGFGNICVDSPLQTALFNNVRMQNEYDWYQSHPGTSIRATLHDGYFLAQPNSTTSLVAFSNNVFIGPFVLGPASFNGTVMTVTTPPTGTYRAGMRLEATGVDGGLSITIQPIGTTDPSTGLPSTGTGGVGTYVISANVGVIPSTTVRATSTFNWNIAFMSPDGVSQVALDVGQRNAANALTIGGRSQKIQYRFTDNTISNERIMMQWIEPLASGGALYLETFAGNTPASYAIGNNANNGAAYLAQNHARTDWIDMLHLDGLDRTVLGGGGATTYISTSQGVGLQVVDDGVATANSVVVRAGTSATAARIYTPGGNMGFANAQVTTSSTTGFVSAYPVCSGVPTGIPARVNSATAFGVYNTASKNLNIFDPTANAWYHVALTAGAA